MISEVKILAALSLALDYVGEVFTRISIECIVILLYSTEAGLVLDVSLIVVLEVISAMLHLVIGRVVLPISITIG